jgi:O-antigen/teichoic acid export membrane protein
MRKVEHGYMPKFRLDKPALRKISTFALLTFSAYLCWGLPNWILPIMVLNRIDADHNAYFAVAWTIGTIIGAVPSAVSTSLLAEGSFNKEELGLNTSRSLRFTYLILIPAVVIMMIIAEPVLRLFGGVYAENASFLIRIITVTNLPLTLNAMYISTRLVEMKLNAVFILAVWIAGVSLGTAYALSSSMGIDGVGISWLVAHTSAAIATGTSLLRSRGKTKTGQSTS